jgi:hypothetical protein
VLGVNTNTVLRASEAGHSQSTITDRYIHAAQVLFPGAAEKAEPACSGRGSKTGSKTPRKPA